MEEFTSESIALPDGRTLAYATYGPEDGTPLVFHHGTPGSARLGALLSTPARERGVRVIAPSRPGYGRSDPDPDGTFESWAADCRALADALDLESFAVAGFSGGGPFALSVAAALPDRVSAIGVLSAPVPAHDDGPFGALVGFPRLLGAVFRVSDVLAAIRGDRIVVGQLTDRPVSDEVAAVVGRDFRRALTGGTTGAVRESRLLAGEWSLPDPDVDGRVVVWHGTADENVPIGPVRTAYGDRSGISVREVDADHLGALLTSRGELVELVA